MTRQLSGIWPRFLAAIRPISVAVVPLVVATGAGAASRRDIGVTVFSGMLAATAIGILLIPGLFVLLQRVSEWRGGMREA